MPRGSYEPNREEQTPPAGNGRDSTKTKDVIYKPKNKKEEDIHELSPLRPLDEREEETIKVVPIAPDGGYGWIIVAASFFCNFIVDGVAYSFAIYLVEWMDKFRDSDKESIALIGSLLNGVYLLMGPISSALTNAFGFRPVIFSGALIAAFAFVISMFARSIPYLIGTFGIVGGIGFGLIYSPSILCVCYYFEKKRAMAVGISVCGSGVGAFVFPPVIQMVINHFGWEGSMLILAGLVLQVCVAGSLMKNLEVQVVEEVVEILPAIDPVERPLSQPISEKETLTYVRDAHGGGLNRTVSQEAKEGNFRDLKHVKRARTASGASDDVEYVVSRRYSSRDGIDVQHVDDQGRIVHERKTGPHHQYSSQHDLNDGGLTGTTKHSEYAPALDRKDVLVQGNMTRHLSRQESQREDQDAFHRDSLRRKQEKKEKEAAAKPGAKPAKKSFLPPQLRQALIEMIDVSIYKNPIFLIFSLASFLGMIAFYVPFTFMNDAAVKKWDVDKVIAAYLISGIGGANIFGRIFWGWLADRPRSDPLLIHNLCITVVGIVLGCVPLAINYGTYEALMGTCVLFGFFVSPFISLLSIILTSRIGLDQLPSAFGQSQLVRGIASMVGTPIGAALYQIAQNYTITFLVSGAEFILASLIASMIFVLSYCSRRKRAAGAPGVHVVA